MRIYTFVGTVKELKEQLKNKRPLGEHTPSGPKKINITISIP